VAFEGFDSDSLKTSEIFQVRLVGRRSACPTHLEVACDFVSEIELSFEGHVAVIKLAAEARRNALTPTMCEDLVAACDEVDWNADVGAVVITGGPYFCAGAHRDTLAGAGADPLADPNHANLSVVYRAFVRVGELEAPTVAAVRGGAIGAGINLALATDLRIVADDAQLMAGFSRIGLHPGGGFFVLSGRTAGRETTAALGLFGEAISGQHAADLGIAWEAVPDGDVEARAMELATRAGDDPDLARRTTRSFRQELGPPLASWPVAVDAERAAQMWSMRRKA
jgi:enoyl-CoA hydratase